MWGNSLPFISICAAAGEAKETPALCEQTSPDIVLMDVLTAPVPMSLTDTFGQTGIDVTGQIRQMFPLVKVIIMTGLSDISLFDAAKKAGAHSFIYKNISDDRFLSIIRATMDEYNTFPEKLSAELPFLGSFTGRELRVLRLFCQGKTRSQIAVEMRVSEALIKAIVTSLLNKTGFDSVLRLAVYMTSSGFIMPNLDVNI